MLIAAGGYMQQINKHLPSIANSRMTNEAPLANGNNTIEKLPIALVDEEGSRLARKYNNPDYLGWYCEIVYCLGLSHLRELERRAEDGSNPGRLFSSLAREALRRNPTYQQIVRDRKNGKRNRHE